jgi:toxin-antitoxin system PIN domain toxin
LIAVDTNVLVHAHRGESPKHRAAKARLVGLAEGSTPWAIPVFCLGEMMRLLTHPRIFDPPHTAAEAAEALARLTESPALQILNPGPEFPRLLAAAILDAGATGNLVFDAQIVALCQEAGVERLLSEDRDFMRFRAVTLERLPD